MPSNAQVYIIVSSKDQASKVLKGIGQAAEDMGENVENAGDEARRTGKESEGLAGILSGKLQGALTVGVALAATKAAFELGELGAQSLRTAHAFENISGGAGEAGERLEAMRRATRGAMSEMQMMASANQLMQMGLASNAEELETVTKMAVKLGTAMGATAGEAISNFSLMLANQSIPRLDSFGISSGKVRERIAELQKQTKGMTREAAFMQAVMEEGGKAMDRLGEDVDDSALGFEQLGAVTTDLKILFAEELAPATGAVAGAVADVGRELATSIRTMHEYEKVLGETTVQEVRAEVASDALADASAVLAGEMAAGAGAAYDQDKALKTLARMMDEITVGPSKRLMKSQMEAAGVFGTTTEAIDETATATDRLATSTSTVARSFGELEFDNESLWDMALATGANVEQLSALAQQLGIANQAEIQASIKSYELVEAFGKGTLSAKEYADQMARLASATADADARLAAIEARGARAGGGHARYQAGTMYHPGGMALVGEAGPELVDMPHGTHVYPSTSPVTQNYTRHGDSYNVNINDPLAAALFLEQTRQQSIERANAYM